MRKISSEVKKAINEMMDEYDAFEEKPIWNDDKMDNEADENGVIEVNIGSFVEGGRENMVSTWNLELIEEYVSYWHVKATCVSSDYRRYRVGVEVEFDLDKDDLNIFDLPSYLEDALRENEF